MRYAIQAIMIVATCIVTMSSVAKAENIVSKVSYISSYADSEFGPEFGPEFGNGFKNDKSALFQKFDLTEEEHELNDSWLGMFVKSSNGTIVGTIAYAFLDADGEISELLVELSASNLDYAVFVDGDNARLNELDVKIDLSISQIAKLEREQPNQFAQN